MKIKVEDVRNVGQNQDKCMVYFNLTNNKTLPRTVSSQEIVDGNVIRNNKGEQARIDYWVDLFNRKYEKPQVTRQQAEPSNRMQVLMEREAMLKGMTDVPIPNDDIEELRKVREEIDYLAQTD